MTIERLSASTVDSAFTLCLSLKEHYKHPSSFWSYAIEDLKRLVGSDEKRTFVSVVDGTVIGIGTLTRGGHFQDHWAEISIAIHPSHRKAGTGKRLGLELEKEGKEIGLEFINSLICESFSQIKSVRLDRFLL